MASSSSSTLPNVLGSLKRPAPPDAKPIKGSAKRQKGKEKEDKVREAAVKAFDRRWEKILETAAAWRQDLLASLQTPSLRLLATLDHVRQASSRPLLTQAQKALVPASTELQNMLLDFFLHPLTWSSIKHSAMLERRECDDVELDEGSAELEEDKPGSEQEGDLAQFYVRRLVFSDHESLKRLLDQVKSSKPHYTRQIEGLVKESSKIVTGERRLSYGGFTIANTPVGREIDDEDAAASKEWGFLKTLLAAYKGIVEIYEVPALRFSVGNGGHHSVITGRNDLRTSLYESLIIDSHGFLCLNTAPPGTVRQTAFTAEDLVKDEAIRKVTFPPASFSFLF